REEVPEVAGVDVVVLVVVVALIPEDHDPLAWRELNQEEVVAAAIAGNGEPAAVKPDLHPPADALNNRRRRDPFELAARVEKADHLPEVIEALDRALFVGDCLRCPRQPFEQFRRDDVGDLLLKREPVRGDAVPRLAFWQGWAA